MYSKLNLSTRLNALSGLEDSQGSLFVNDVDFEGRSLEGFNVLHFGFDTIKQKFKGILSENLIKPWLQRLEGNFKIEVDFFNHIFQFSKAPRASGFRYLLQNKSLGIHLFFGSFHKVEWFKDGIAKAEFSPQLIHEHGLENLYYIAQNLADLLFVSGWFWNGVESHICADVQGWKPEQEFLENITTTSQVKRAFNTSHLVAADLSEMAVRYANSESFLIGKAGRSQLAAYNKTAESKVTGKYSWWLEVYKEHPLFDESKDVFRIELRLHDSVLKNLGNPETGENYGIVHLMQLADHVHSLWRYGLFKLFRYHYTESDVVRPEWQFLAESVQFDVFTENEFFYKRVESEIIDDTIQKNLEQAIGHLASAFAKANIPDDTALKSLRRLPIYKHLCFLYEEKGMSAEFWESEFIKKLQERKRKFSYMQNNPFRHVPNYRDKGGSNAQVA
jgi:hypothetical protein